MEIFRRGSEAPTCVNSERFRPKGPGAREDIRRRAAPGGAAEVRIPSGVPRQNKTIRSYSGTGTAVLTDDLVFPFPMRSARLGSHRRQNIPPHGGPPPHKSAAGRPADFVRVACAHPAGILIE